MDKELVKDRVAQVIYRGEGRETAAVVDAAMAELDRIWREDGAATAAVLCAEAGCDRQAVKYRHKGNPERLPWCAEHWRSPVETAAE